MAQKKGYTAGTQAKSARKAQYEVGTELGAQTAKGGQQYGRQSAKKQPAGGSASNPMQVSSKDNPNLNPSDV